MVRPVVGHSRGRSDRLFRETRVTTTADLIETTRSELFGAQQEQLNSVAASITATDTSLQLTYSTDGLQRGMSVSVGLEDMYVWDYSASDTTVTVQRGSRGTTPTAHVAGELVYVQPRYSSAVILREINADLRSLSSPSNGLFRVKTLPLVGSHVNTAYDLEGSGDILEIISVQVDTAGSDISQPPVHSSVLERAQDENTFSSGTALQVYEAVPGGRPMTVVYKAPFTELTGLTQNVETVSGLPQSAHDIPPLGAQAKLIGVSEARRAQTQGQPDTRRAAEVPSGSAARGASVLMQLRRQRVAEERARLQQRWPVRRWT